MTHRIVRKHGEARPEHGAYYRRVAMCADHLYIAACRVLGKARDQIRCMSYGLSSHWGAVLIVVLGALAAPAQSETVVYYYVDHQGTPLVTADSSGEVISMADYRPYGARILGTQEDGPGYTGHVHDSESGLVYMQSRYYDPIVARFFGPDPNEVRAGNPLQFSRYAYAAGNPVTNVDPNGREAACVSSPSHCGGIGKGIENFPGNVASGVRFVNDELILPNVAANPAFLGEASIALEGLATIIEGGALTEAVAGGGEAMTALETGSEVPIAASNTARSMAKLGDLRPTHGQTMSNRAMKALTNSIKESGVQSPLTVTEHEGASYIVDGNNRFVAAMRAGVKEVPVIKKELPFGAYKNADDLDFTP
ncbi:RHS repeat-associated core domain-containing protein [Luteibacter sp. UNCMF331Sha3.1]|uniref:RHS repeat-associated core domain-containing protein n=1 Tax=Luteibacter sp. UNCMF331Sha3.1 TaxID=1502760 RepID=UPI0008AAA3D2|nr:RHS repeat-associated core domain-containing protein [Luteibacter sp. UNCMF331Sha3.1]SEM54378.1 RHS repeat-associated core domain-containing protein [Luteibacter sp. UNCMF331Sha3.1]